MMRTLPGLMSGPAWRAGPSWIVSEVLGKGPEVHLRLIPPEPLRLLKDWIRDYSCRWGLLLLLWSAKSDPGPEAVPTPSEDHVCSQKRKAAGLTAGNGSALRSH